MCYSCNGNKPLFQICRRYNEISYVHKTQPKIGPEIIILKSNYVESRKINIKRLRYKDVLITIQLLYNIWCYSLMEKEYKLIVFIFKKINLN